MGRGGGCITLISQTIIKCIVGPEHKILFRHIFYCLQSKVVFIQNIIILSSFFFYPYVLLINFVEDLSFSSFQNFIIFRTINEQIKVYLIEIIIFFPAYENIIITLLYFLKISTQQGKFLNYKFMLKRA